MKRVAGYVRVSRVAGRTGDSFQSPDAQEESIRAHCKAHRLEVVDVVRELDESGGSMARPKLQRLIAEVEAGTLNGIVVARIDRFARTLVGGVHALGEIHAAGGFVQTVEGGIDTSSTSGAMGELQLNLLLTLAQWERATRAEGFELAKVRAVSRGVHIAGKVPVGYLRPSKGARLELDPAKARAVRDAFELRANGATFGAVSRMLDVRLPGGPSGGGVWNRNTVTRLLSNPVYTGEARQGEHRRGDAHLPIVSRGIFDTVQALGRRVEPAERSSEVRSLLAGICRCGACGYALDRNTVNRQYLVYRCRGRSASGVCEAPASAMVDAVDAFVEEAVLGRLAAYSVEQVAADEDLDELHARIAAARAKREPFEDPDYVQALGIAAATRALARTDEEIQALETELAGRVVAHDALPPQEVAGIWPTLTVAEKNTVIAAMVDSVLISRAPRGTPLSERIAIYWTGDDVPLARPSRGRGRGNSPEVEPAVAAA